MTHKVLSSNAIAAYVKAEVLRTRCSEADGALRSELESAGTLQAELGVRRAKRAVASVRHTDRRLWAQIDELELTSALALPEPLLSAEDAAEVEAKWTAQQTTQQSKKRRVTKVEATAHAAEVTKKQ